MKYSPLKTAQLIEISEHAVITISKYFTEENLHRIKFHAFKRISFSSCKMNSNFKLKIQKYEKL